jgi:hypothetical protein
VTSETKEVGAFRRLELESAGDCGDDLGRNPDVPALLEPGVPGEPYAGKIRHFLPPEAGGASAATVGEADRRRRNAVAAALKEVAELRTGGGSNTRITRHLVTGYPMPHLDVDERSRPTGDDLLREENLASRIPAPNRARCDSQG